LLLNENGHFARYYEERGTVNWLAGTKGLAPSVHYRRSSLGGRVPYKKELSKSYVVEQLSFPKLVKSMATSSISTRFAHLFSAVTAEMKSAVMPLFAPDARKNRPGCEKK